MPAHWSAHTSRTSISYNSATAASKRTLITPRLPVSCLPIAKRQRNCGGTQRDTGAAAAPVSLTLPTPGSRLRRWPAWATRAGTLLHRQQRVPRRPVAFRPSRPTALHGATKGKLRWPPPSVFPWKPFPPSRYVGRRYSPWTTRTVRHTRTNRSAMPSNCAPCWIKQRSLANVPRPAVGCAATGEISKTERNEN